VVVGVVTVKDAREASCGAPAVTVGAAPGAAVLVLEFVNIRDASYLDGRRREGCQRRDGGMDVKERRKETWVDVKEDRKRPEKKGRTGEQLECIKDEK
jgi:hypothetical protein